MSAWRKIAIECLPEQKQYFEDPNTSIYTVFNEILLATRQAHKSNDIAQLKKFYDFAEWCLNQKDKDLWNAAGVSFYEHLGQQPESLKAMPDWVKPEIYKSVKGLLELFISKEDMERLDNSYRNRFPKEFKE